MYTNVYIFVATPLIYETKESSSTKLTLSAMIQALCHAANYVITVTFGVQAISSGDCDTSNGVTKEIHAIPGLVYDFTVETQELFLNPDHMYCYDISVTAAVHDNAKVHSKFKPFMNNLSI